MFPKDSMMYNNPATQFAPAQFFGMPSDEQTLHIMQVIRVREDELTRIDADIAQLRKVLARLLDNRADIRASLEAHKSMLTPPEPPAIDRIPPEVWGLIFEACNDVTWGPGLPKVDCNSAPMLLGQVCSGWRAMVLEMPRLWASICVPKHTKLTVLPLLELWLERSGSMPLSIEIHGRSHDLPPALLEPFAAHSSRWKNAALFLPDESTSALFSRPDLDLSMLSNLMLRQSGNPRNRIATNETASQLRSVSLIASRHRPINTAYLDLSWAQLTKLSMTFVEERRIDDGYDVLAQCSSLTHLSLVARESQFDSTRHPLLRLDNLTSLQIVCLSDPRSFIECLILPSLLQLDIDFVSASNRGEAWPKEELMDLWARSDCPVSLSGMATALAALLPQPTYAPAVSDDEDDFQQPAPSQSQSLISRNAAPPYGQRSTWRPTKAEDFGDGGAFPECHVAQYPLEMGKKKASSGNTLALQVDSEGNIRYDAIAHQGQAPGKTIQSQFKDLVPLAHRKDLDESARDMERPSEDEVQATADKTRLALEKLTTGKIKAAQPKNVPGGPGKTAFIRYTPGQQNGSSSLQQRIIKMTDVVEDPLEPPRFKHKKIPRGPPTPPPPVLRSPPRKATAAEQKEWMIPPCISNWKNNKGFTIPLDKRLAADGRGLQDVHINDNFAKFSEALFVADRHAREEVRQRSLMQQKLAQKEKASKEENLRLLAQRAREERGGLAPSKPTAESRAAMKSTLADYGSDSGSGSDAGEESDAPSEEDEEARKIRDDMRAEKRREREREMRMSNMGAEQRAKQLARQQNRDISEKVALGLAKPTLSKESMLDSRLFNQESLGGSFADEDSYNLYDRPLFHGSTAAAAIYKASANITEGNEESFGGGTEDGIGKALNNDRFGLGQAKVGFEGASEQEIREGPVQFEKDSGDVFGLDKFLDEAKTGKKRGLDTGAGGARKRQQLDKANEMD
ncbi:hypothetical protein HWV62_26306 [Athelia sp. TMB]|nr:hypothetical protein HWV62_26306 [Athelia sp. TMB]